MTKQYLTKFVRRPVNLVYVAVFIIVVLILIWVVRRWVSVSNRDMTEYKSKKQIKDWDLSHEDAQYAVLADKIEQAFHDFGTDEKMIYKVFDEIYTDSDVYKLIDIYGRRYNWDWFIPYNRNLPESLYAEMTTAEIDKINQKMSANGINFKF